MILAQTECTLIRRMIEENPMGSRPLGKTNLRWKDAVKREVERMEFGT